MSHVTAAPACACEWGGHAVARAMKADLPEGARRVPGVSVAVVAHGSLQEARGYGLLAADRPAHVGTRSMFHAASMSKLVTALGVLRLASQGRVGLDEDVNDRLRSWRMPCNDYTDRAPVTLRTLLSHQGGVVDPDGSFGICDPQQPPHLLDVLHGGTPLNPRPVRVEHPPGNRFSYSDAGYCVIEQLLTDVTHTRFPDLMAELVLDPLGMTRSRFGSPADVSDMADVAAGHDEHGKVVDGRQPVYPYLAAAGLWSTPSDLARVVLELHQALAGKGNLGLAQDIADGMVRGQASTAWAGLGTFVGGETGRVRITSLGWGVGFQCMLRAYPHRGDAVVVMTNSDPGRPQEEALTGQLVHCVEKQRRWAPD